MLYCWDAQIATIPTTKPKPRRVTLTLSLAPDLVEQLDEMARDARVTRSFMWERVAMDWLSWKPSLEQLELLASHRGQLLPVDETARQLGVTVACLEEFALRLERGKAAALPATQDTPPARVPDAEEPSIPSGFPAMMRGR